MLPVTVILLALVAVGVALIAQRSDQMRALAIAARQEQAAAADAGAGIAQALTLLATRHRRTSRLGVIELDGRHYRSGNVMISSERCSVIRPIAPITVVATSRFGSPDGDHAVVFRPASATMMILWCFSVTNRLISV